MSEDIEEFVFNLGMEQVKHSIEVQNMTKKFRRKFLDERRPEVAGMVKALLECINRAEEPMYLRDIAVIVVARARSLENFRLFSGIYKEGGRQSERIIRQEWAIHQWLVALQKNEMLKGNYNEYTGRYRP